MLNNINALTMKTEVEMRRVLFDSEIRQKSKSEFFCATDLVRAGNKWRLENGMQPFDFNKWKNSSQTKDFIQELTSQFGCVIISGKGRGNYTWVHPFLFIDLALAINPKLKVEVYSWLYDCLLKYRNDSGDSYKRMCGALFDNTTKKSRFSEAMKMLGVMIKKEVGVEDWQTARQEQLEYRDKIHEYIALMCGVFHNNNNEAVRIGMLKAREYLLNKNK